MKGRLKRLARLIPGRKASEEKQENPPKQHAATGGIRGLGIGAKKQR